LLKEGLGYTKFSGLTFVPAKKYPNRLPEEAYEIFIYLRVDEYIKVDDPA